MPRVQSCSCPVPKMGLLRGLSILILLSALHAGCMGSPLTWQLTEIDDEVLEREERSAGSGLGSGSGGSGSGGWDPVCGDDEDCLNPDGNRPTHTMVHPPPKMLSMHVKTIITARYVSTTVVTKMRNRADISQDSDFRFRLSKEAFISNFSMEVNDRVYQAEVREKEEAQKAYNEARRLGQTAAQVKQRGDDFTKFETNINLSPNTTAIFTLTFQELLRRKNGVFRHRVNLFPKEVVSNLRADVYITEPQGISFANITWEQDDRLPSDFLYDALTVTRKSDTSVHASMIPSREDQEGLSSTGLQGDLVVTYDVVHDSGAGHIEVVNGYFVHHISPEGLPKTRKNVVFAIDISGSMYGRKIAQTKAAMSTIIDEIREIDRFNIICFAHTLVTWESTLMEGTASNKARAQEYVNNLRAEGGTDIFLALDDAVRKLKEALAVFNEGLPMIILLTDGEPTSGLTDRNQIVERTTDMINGEMALFSLAFGSGADYKLLEKLSGFNQGVARKIYEDSSAGLQLEGFYHEVANPLLCNVKVRYTDGAVEEETLTPNNFISYFEGTEFVVAGKLKEDFLDAKDEISAVVSGNSFDVKVEWKLEKTIRTTDENEQHVLKPHQVDDFAQRLWAYVTVKDLLLKHKIAISNSEKEKLKERALSIALKYSFVTPLTSLIVIKPEEEENYDDIHSIDEEEEEEEAEISAQGTSGYQYDQQTYASQPAQQVPYSSKRPSLASVYGDPHFTVNLPGENASMCFETKAREGMIVNLMKDPKSGVSVSGRIRSVTNATVVKSYFSTLGFSLGKHRLTVTASEISTDIGLTLGWKSEASVSFGGFVVQVFPSVRVLAVSSAEGVLLHVTRHRPRKERFGMDHLGFYVQDIAGFSDQLGGLIGQFYSPSETHLEHPGPGEVNGVLVLEGVRIPVIWHARNGRRCWHAGSTGLGNLDPTVFEEDSLFQ